MSVATETATVIDLAADTETTAHLACRVEHQLPDEPTHALCGHPLVGVDAPPAAPHCSECEERLKAGGGPFAMWLGVVRCDRHAS